VLQQLMRERGLTRDELQSRFICRLVAFFADRGRRLVGWDEILEAASHRMRP
jgi:hexosaminidase